MLHRKPGFSLLEVLIYSVFVGMIMTSMTFLAYTAFTVRSKLRTSFVLEENLRFAVERITSLVSSASGISSPLPGASGGTLVLTMPTATTSPTTISLSGGTMFITQGSGASQSLTSNEISISSLVFTRISSTTPIVRIVATGGSRNAPATYATLTVTTTASVRR